MDDDEDVLFDQQNLLAEVEVSPRVSRVPASCRRITKTLCLCAAFFGLGMCIAIPGPTLLDLQIITNTTTEEITRIFTGRSTGYLVGSILSGVLFDKFNQDCLLSFALILTAVGTAWAPWSHNYIAMMGLFATQGLSMGFLDTGGNVMCIHTWGRDSGPYMQALHFSFGLGAFVSPLIAEPFLGHPVNSTELANLSLVSSPASNKKEERERRSEWSWGVEMGLPHVIYNQHRKTRQSGNHPNINVTKPGTNGLSLSKHTVIAAAKVSSTTATSTATTTTSTSTTTSTTNPTTTTSTTTTTTPTGKSTVKAVVEEGIMEANSNSSVTQRVLVTLQSLTKVQFAYLTVALFVLLVGATFLCLCCSALCGSAPLGQCHLPSEYHIHKESRGFRVQLLLLLFVFYFFYVGMEVTYGGLIMTFAVDCLHWSKERGTLLTSVFWGSFAASRGLAVFLARFLSPTLMLIADLALTTLALVGLLLTVDHNPNMVWYCTAALGAGMASIFPTGITWAERYMHVGSKAAAVFVVGSALGEMAMPALTGLLFDLKGPMWLLYIMLGCALTSIVIYIFLQNLASGKGERYQRLNNLLNIASALDENHELDRVVTSTGYAENGQVRKTVTFDLPGDSHNGSPQTKSVGKAKYTLLKSNTKND